MKRIHKQKTHNSTEKTPNILNRQFSMTENHCMTGKQNSSAHRVVLVKGNVRWRFEWVTGQEIKTVRVITEIAQSSQTDFDWFDAAMVCHEMSKMTANAA
jgi:hypothetical protein